MPLVRLKRWEARSAVRGINMMILEIAYRFVSLCLQSLKDKADIAVKLTED